MSRPDIDNYFISMAVLASSRATCSRRKVGAILVNSRMHVISTGYNGVASGMTHCIEKRCPGADAASGTGLEMCEAIHAEQNALLQCNDVHEIYAAYVTTSPCVTCTKLLLNTGCRKIVFLQEYPQPMAKQLWTRSHREWIQFTDLENLLVKGIHNGHVIS